MVKRFIVGSSLRAIYLQMEEIDGIREGTHRYVHDGFVYHLDMRNNVYRCGYRGSNRCRGLARIEENRVVIMQPHVVHPPNPHIHDEVRMRAELIRMCKETWLPILEIYREVSVRYCEAVQSAVSLRTVRSMMDRARTRALPEVPRNLLLLGLMLRNHPPMENLYRGMTGAGDGHHALFFARNEMIERMNHANEIFISCPVQVNVEPSRKYKLRTMYMRQLDMVVPVMYLLYQGKSQPLFVSVWRHMLELAPGLQDSIRVMVCPYEKDIIRSLREVWQRIEITGCWFFFCAALCRKWQQLRLIQAPREVLYMALSIPLAPVVRFAEGLQSTQVTADAMINEHPQLLNFIHALRTHWLPLSDLLTVARTSLRSNDMTERFERNLLGKLRGPHRHLWAFFDRLDAMIATGEAEWHNPQPFPHNRSSIREEARIANLQDLLSTGRINIKEFLVGIVDHRRRAAIDSIIIDTRGHSDVHFDDENINRRDIVGDDGVAEIIVEDAAPELLAGVEAVRAVIEAPAVNIGVQAQENQARAEENEQDVHNAPRENAVAPPVHGPNDVRIRPCSACLGEPPRVLYNDCHHLVLCEACDRLLPRRNCPVCRAPIVSTTIVFYG